MTPGAGTIPGVDVPPDELVRYRRDITCSLDPEDLFVGFGLPDHRP